MSSEILEKAEKISKLSETTVEVMRASKILGSSEPFTITIEGTGSAKITVVPVEGGYGNDFANQLLKVFRDYRTNLITKTIHEIRGYKI